MELSYIDIDRFLSPKTNMTLVTELYTNETLMDHPGWLVEDTEAPK